MPEASLIAIDWGTTSARAYALDNRGAIVAEKSAPLGVQRITNGRFADALASLCAGIGAENIPMIACGMIGSRQGWVEVPYRDCPADFSAVATSLTRVDGTRLAIVPGLMCRDVDGVPARVYRRYFGLEPAVPASSDPELWRVVAEASPARKNKEWNWAVLDLASSVCLPKVPRCHECPLAAHCHWSQAHG